MSRNFTDGAGRLRYIHDVCTRGSRARQSRLPEYPGTIADGHTHVLALAERFADYARAMRGGIARATDVEDAGSAAVYTEISRDVDKRLWSLDAHLYHGGASVAPQDQAGSTDE